MDLKPEFLVADSGSTKTDWLLCSPENGIVEVRTSGINPVRDSQDAVSVVVMEQLMSHLPGGCAPQSVYFYGAGCMPPYAQFVKTVLEQSFPMARVEVESDLLGAARALCGSNPGIACILGTGANSCFYDGQVIAAHVPPLGFILGDEGSGAVLGRTLLGNLLKGIFPAAMREEFMREYQLTEAGVIDKVYRQPQANQFLASLVPFIQKHRQHPQVHEMLVGSFRSFFSRNVRAYGHSDLPVNCVGGIASSFADELREAAVAEGMYIGKLLRGPIREMLSYHTHRHVMS
ncbi:MAG: ATPase [Bacteroidaceae bacterium]